MTIIMVKTIKEERLRWIKPIIDKEVRLVDVSKICPHGKRSLERWVSVYKKYGESGLEPKSTTPKTQPKEKPIWIKEKVIDPGKPAQNSTVERSHREDQEKFYEGNKFKTFNDLQKKLKRWNIYYNNLEHCGLGGQTPNEFLSNYTQN